MGNGYKGRFLHSLVPFLTTIGKSKSFVCVLVDCVGNGDGGLTMSYSRT